MKTLRTLDKKKSLDGLETKVQLSSFYLAISQFPSNVLMRVVRSDHVFARMHKMSGLLASYFHPD